MQPQLHAQLAEVLATYRSLAPAGWREGPLMGGELPLPPEHALRLADDLQALGVAIMGIDGWVYLDEQKEHIVEDRTIDFYVGDEVLTSDDAVRRSVALVKEYITTRLPKTTPLVSFTLNIPPGWDLAANVGQIERENPNRK